MPDQFPLLGSAPARGDSIIMQFVISTDFFAGDFFFKTNSKQPAEN